MKPADHTLRPLFALIALVSMTACTTTTRVVEVTHYSKPRTRTVVVNHNSYSSGSAPRSHTPTPSEFRVVNQYDNDAR